MSIEAGNTVKAYGYEWEILDTDYHGNGGILCLMKGQIREMAFSKDNNNDYAVSDIREYLEELTEELENKGAEFQPIIFDLTADDGTGWDKDEMEADGLFLLTANMYREYRRHISDKDNWWWLATAYSFHPGHSHSARIVHAGGTLGSYHANRGYIGVVPACIFSVLPEDDHSP